MLKEAAPRLLEGVQLGAGGKYASQRLEGLWDDDRPEDHRGHLISRHLRSEDAIQLRQTMTNLFDLPGAQAMRREPDLQNGLARGQDSWLEKLLSGPAGVEYPPGIDIDPMKSYEGFDERSQETQVTKAGSN